MKNHYTRWGALIVAGVFLFLGAAGYAVYNGATERENQANLAKERDVAICKAVIGVRRDLVEVIRDQESRAIKNVRKLGLDVQEAKESYRKTLDKIGDEECP